MIFLERPPTSTASASSTMRLPGQSRVEEKFRSTRESTTCSLIRDPDIVQTPGSTTRPTCSVEANRKSEAATRRHIPTAREMDEFFADAEEAQQRRFVEKYNFDSVNDKPLPGCYEWEKLEP